MKNTKYRKLINNLENSYKTDPEKYLKSTKRMINVGYFLIILGITSLFLAVFGIIFFLLSIFELLGGIVFYSTISIFILLYFLAQLGCLNSDFEMPYGYLIMPYDAPRLFEHIKYSLEKSNIDQAELLDCIIINPDYNMSVTYATIKDSIGKTRPVLVIGMTFLMAHNLDEINSTLAHEFGHVMHPRSKVRNSAYNLQLAMTGRTSEEIRKVDDEKHDGKSFSFVPEFIRIPFLNRLDARLIVLRRQEEYDADQFSAKIFGVESQVRTFCRLYFAADAINQYFWPSIWKLANHNGNPPSNVYELLWHKISDPIGDESSRNVFKYIKNDYTSIFSSHPCLTDRIRNIGGKMPDEIYWPTYLPREESAAQLLLTPEFIEKYRTIFSNDWREAVAEEWGALNKQFKDNRERKLELEKKGGYKQLTEDQQWEYATLDFMDLDESEKLHVIEKFLSAHPHHPEANLAVGIAYLHKGLEHKAQELLERASLGNSNCRYKALVGLMQYYEHFGNDEKLQEIDKEIDKLKIEMKNSFKERNTVKSSGKVEKHDLTESEVDQFLELCSEYPMLKKVWIVKKRVKYLADIPHYLVLVQVDGFFTNFASDKVQNEIKLFSEHFDKSHFIEEETASKIRGKVMSKSKGPLYVKGK